MALTDWSLLEIRSPLFFRQKSKEWGAETKTRRSKGANNTKWRGLTEKGQIYTQLMTTTQRRKFHFSSVRLPFLRVKTSIFSTNPANMSQGKRPHQSFLQWGTKRGRFRPNRNRTIIFFSRHFFFLNTYHSWIVFSDFFFTIYFSRSP